jgi:hypothetical protein
MNIPVAVLSILGTALLVDLAAGGQSQTALHLLVSFEIQAAGDQGPALTNLSATTSTAHILEIPSSSGNGQRPGLERDAPWPSQRPWLTARVWLRRELQREVAT